MPWSSPPLARLARVIALAFLASAGVAAAQTTWVVDRTGRGDFVDLQSAVNAAVDGDVIAVRSSVAAVGPVLVQAKGLAIVSTPSAHAPGPLDVVGLPAGSTLLLRNYAYEGSFSVPFAVRIRDCQGAVRIESCDLAANAGLECIRSQDVSVTRTKLFGDASTNPGSGPTSGGALRVEDSSVVLDGVDATGADGWWGSSGLTCTAGGPGTPGLVGLGTSTVWSTGCHFRGGLGGAGGTSLSQFCADGADAPAVWLDAGTRLVRRGGSFFGLLHGSVTSLPGDERTLRVTDNVPSRGTVRLQVTGAPGESAVLLASEVTSAQWASDMVGVYQSAPVAGPRRPLGVLDGSGMLESELLVPDVPDDKIRTWFLQAVLIGAGGSVRFAPVQALLVVGEAVPVAAAGTAVRVDANAPTGGSGASWTAPLTFISDAVSRAWPVPGRPVEIWIRRGTHAPDPSTSQSGPAVFVPSGVHLLGGFAGTETQASQRDPIAHPTTLTGDVLGNDGPGFTGRSDNLARILWLRGGPNGEAVADGLTVEGAHTGAAIYGEDGCRIERCVLRDNETVFFATIVLSGGGAAVRHTTVMKNRGRALRIYEFEAEAVVENCLIHANESNGDLVDVAATRPVRFVHCTIAQNRLQGPDGVALRLRQLEPGSAPLLGLQHSVLYGNNRDGSAGYDIQIAFEGVEAAATLRRSLVAHYPSPDDSTGTLESDPGFVDPLGPDSVPGTGDEDLRLVAGSPAVDAGWETLVPAGLTLDLDGQARRVDDPLTPDTGRGAAPFADLGAFERQ